MKRHLNKFGLILLILLQTAFAVPQDYYSPSYRFINGISPQKLENLLWFSTAADKLLYNQLISSEAPGFIGYHAAPQAVSAYQDIIKISLTEILNIPVKDDFQFLRIPGDNKLNYDSSKDFLIEYNIYKQKVFETANKIVHQQEKTDFRAKSASNAASIKSAHGFTFEQALAIVQDYAKMKNPSLKANKNQLAISTVAASDLQKEVKEINDMTAEIQIRILSLNMALYQTEYEYSPLTIMAYQSNSSYSPIYHTLATELKPFFAKMGIDEKYITGAFDIAKKHLPKDRGMIMVFSEEANSGTCYYSFIDSLGYISHPYGMPLGNKPPSHYIFTQSITNFPELKIVMSNKFSLNPYSNLSIERYSSMPAADYAHYQQELTAYLASLPYDQAKITKYRQELLSVWN